MSPKCMVVWDAGNLLHNPPILQMRTLRSRTQRFTIAYHSVGPLSPPRSNHFHPVWQGVAQGCKTESLVCSSKLGSCPHNAEDKPPKQGLQFSAD